MDQDMVGYGQTGGIRMEWITGIQNAINYISKYVELWLPVRKRA